MIKGNKELLHTVNCLNINKENSLRYHLQGNFYPQHPDYIVNRITTMFKAYWRNRINEDTLKKYMFNKIISESGFYRYQFSEYL